MEKQSSKDLKEPKFKVGDIVFPNLKGLKGYREIFGKDKYYEEMEDGTFKVLSISPSPVSNSYRYNFFVEDKLMSMLEDDLELNRTFPSATVVGYFQVSEPKEVGNYESKGREIGALVDSKQKAYGNAVERVNEVMEAFLKPYLNQENGTYTIPQELLLHLQLMVRTMDKFNRIVNNPKQDLMEEDTYRDIVGYSLLGTEISKR